MDLFELLLAKKLSGSGGGGGIIPSGTKTITANGNDIDVYSYAKVNVNVPNPSTGKLDITTTSEVDVTNYASAQVVDADLVASNIKKDVNILGVVGTYEGSGGGGNVVEEKDVNFYDYDGTLLYSYTAQEIAQLSELPRNPSHTGLTAQGWNWSLSRINTVLTLSPEQKINVGQSYITSSGKTEIDIELVKGWISPYLNLAVNGEVLVEWGDNSTSTITGTSTTTKISTLHNYAIEGKYTISITVVSGSFTFFGDSTTQGALSGTSYNTSYSYWRASKAVRVGNGITNIGDYGLSRGNYKYITLPKTLRFGGQYCMAYTTIQSLILPQNYTVNNSAFNGLTQLKMISLPSNETLSSGQPFSNCSLLQSITMSGTAGSSITSYCFSGCACLTYITIMSNIIQIGNFAFNGCYSLKDVYCHATTPPQWMGTNVMKNVPSDCVIHVPRDSVTAYQQDADWGTFTIVAM